MIPEAKSDDAPEFLEFVQAVVSGAISCYRPRRFRIVRLDNWFGPKWLGFSGKRLGALATRKERLTVPPFVPRRVVEETQWERTEQGFRPTVPEEPLHRRAPSARNLQRFVDREFPGSLLIWFSSRSASNRRGAVMMYETVTADGPTAWYAEVEAVHHWCALEPVGITTEELDVLRKPSTPAWRTSIAHGTGYPPDGIRRSASFAHPRPPGCQADSQPEDE